MSNKIYDGVVRLVWVMHEDVLLAQSFKHRIGIVADANLLRSERRIFQIGTRRFFVQVKNALDIDWAAHAKHQRLVELKLRNEPFDNFRMRAFFDFQAHGAAFTPLRDLSSRSFPAACGFLPVRDKDCCCA